MAGSQRPQSRASTSTPNPQMSGPSGNAALLGALMAFGGASQRNGDMVRSRGNSPGTSGSSLRPPSSLGSRPPSRQTAALAAARPPSPAVPLRPNTSTGMPTNKALAGTQRPNPPPLKPKPRRLSQDLYSKPSSPQPISPVASFVGIIENNTIRSPRPERRPDVLRTPHGGMEVRNQAKAAPHDGKDKKESQEDVTKRQENKFEAAHRSYTRAKAQKHQGQAPASAQDLGSEDESSQEYVSASEDTVPSPVRARTETPPRSRKQAPTPPPARLRPPSSTSHDARSASRPIDIQRPPRYSDSSARSVSSHSNPSLNATYNQLYPRRTTQLTLGDDLANAIVASSLATSRASSPHRLNPQPVSSRRPSHLLPFHSRTPSPTKRGMRHTLREPESSTDSETEQHPYGKHKKKRHLRPKHPNKHHEGDRKRWRDAVTERERRRYEGVWAANKGLLLAATLPNNVSNLVVRDLWTRSRLPQHELEAIWDLVAPRTQPPASSLSKEEFVVGMWLIDQRLKGRKVPVRVSETVWSSVTGLQGIKVKKFGK